jgi:hypothetical protein
MSVKCAGATHDNLAFSVSALNERLMKGDLEDGFWIAADEAYMCSERILTPWHSAELGDEAKMPLTFYIQALGCTLSMYLARKTPDLEPCGDP